MNMEYSRVDPFSVNFVQPVLVVPNNYKHTAGPNIKKSLWKGATCMDPRVELAEYTIGHRRGCNSTYGNPAKVQEDAWRSCSSTWSRSKTLFSLTSLLLYAISDDYLLTKRWTLESLLDLLAQRKITIANSRNGIKNGEIVDSLTKWMRLYGNRLLLFSMIAWLDGKMTKVIMTL